MLADELLYTPFLILDKAVSRLLIWCKLFGQCSLQLGVAQAQEEGFANKVSVLYETWLYYSKTYYL